MAFLEDLKDEVAKSCRIIGRLGLTREPNGHVSARIPDTGHIVMKARGRMEAPLSYVTPEDLCVVDMDGKLVEAREGVSVPQEVYIHTELYKVRPELNAAIHVHPANVVAFTIAGKTLLPIIGAYNPQALRLITDGLPVFDSSVLINSPERGQLLAALMQTSRACLMRGHGITTAGATVEEATLVAIHLNELAELQYKAETLGGARAISDEDLRDFQPVTSAPRASAGEVLPRTHSSEWRYYETRLL
jgi:ribulose-5-phosphate 4-epimerase/fuculose-1-phosphate aldolase